MSKKTGPRPRPETELRRYLLAIRLTPAEQRAVEKAAGQLPMGTWARGVLLAAARNDYFTWKPGDLTVEGQRPKKGGRR